MHAWYVLAQPGSEARPEGPFPFEEIAARVASGSIETTTLVARAGSDRWIRAVEDADLAALFRSAPPRDALAASASAAMARSAAMLDPTSGYSFSEAFATAWRTLKSRWGVLVVGGLLLMLIYGVIGAPQWILQDAARASGDHPIAAVLNLAGSCFNLVANILVGGPMFAGAILLGAEAVAGRGEVGDLFAAFRRYWQVVLANLLVAAIGIGVSIAVVVPSLVVGLIVGASAHAASGANGSEETAVIAGVIAGGAVMLVLSVVATALVLLRVFLTPAIIADPRLGIPTAMDALRLNWQQTRGLGWSLTGLLVCVGLVAAGSLLLLCVGYILLGVPLLIAALGAVYAMLFRRVAPSMPAEETWSA